MTTNNFTDCVLAIDIGSSSIKAGLFSSQCDLVEGSLVAVPHYQKFTSDGGVEENASLLRSSIESVIDGIVAMVEHRNLNIITVAIDSMASTIVGLDKNNDPVTPFFSYADTRNSDDVDDLKSLIDVDLVHQRTGVIQHTSYLPARIMWYKRTQPQLYSEISKWVDISTYIYLQWFHPEKVKSSFCISSWSGMIDRFRRSWDQELLNILDIDLFNLPQLSSWDEPVSGLNKQFSDRWKPLKEVPFLLSVGDGLTANLGSGCVDSSKLAVTIGSTGAMRTIVSGNPKVPMGLWAYCFGRDMNILGGSFTEGGNVLVWARQSLGIDTNKGIDNLLDGKKPDSHNLTVLPFLSGERSVGWNGSATATIKGLKMTTSGTDILQALCESIAYRFADVMERITPYLSTDLEVIASGGALVESRWWVKTIANVLNKPITVCDVEQQTLYGTAKLALKSLGLINNFDDIPIKRRYVSEPDVTLIEMMASARERQGDLYTKLM